MRLVVLGSGSRGNAFVVLQGEEGQRGQRGQEGQEGQSALLVEAGFGRKTLTRRAAAAGVDLKWVRGIVLTHEHGDHSQGAVSLASRLGVPLLCSRGTWHALGRPESVTHHPVRPARPFEFAGFRIDAALTTHDATEPLAVTVESGGVRIAFATDVGRPTAGIRYLLRAAHAVVLECNYDDMLLRAGRYPPSVQERIAGSRGHLSNRAAADLLAEVCHVGLGAVVLAHLSQECNSTARAREIVEPVLRRRGFRGALWVADQDRPLDPITVQSGPAADQWELALQWGPGSAAGGT